MTVEFFFCQEMEYSSERRAFYRAAKLLHQKFAGDERYFALVGNVSIPNTDLPQIDAILLSETMVVLIDFKRCGDPIEIPENEKAGWYATSPSGEKYVVRGGSAKNPRIQARKAHYAWSHHLRHRASKFLSDTRISQLTEYWNHIKGWVLFEPRLHPQNNPFPTTKKDWRWLTFADVGDIVGLWYAQKSNLRLTPVEIKKLAKNVLHAHRKSDFSNLFGGIIGYLTVPDKSNIPIRHPISRFETLTIGRSGKCDIHIPKFYTRTSGEHAYLETGLAAVRIFDAHSTNGTFIDNREISAAGELLSDGTTIILGKPRQVPQCRLRFETAVISGANLQTAVTR